MISIGVEGLPIANAKMIAWTVVWVSEGSSGVHGWLVVSEGWRRKSGKHECQDS